MENNLSLNESLVPLLKSWKELHGTAVACADGDSGFPAEISGLKGSLPGFFVAQFLERRRLDAIHEEQYGRAQMEEGRKKGRKEGRKEGVMETLIPLIKDGVLTLKEAAARFGISEEALRKRL